MFDAMSRPRRPRHNGASQIIVIGGFAVWYVCVLTGCVVDARFPGRSERNKPFPRKSLVELEQAAALIGTAASPDDMRQAFATRGEHQFALARDNVEYMCICYDIIDGFGYYCLFSDGRLHKVMEQPQPFGCVDEHGKRFYRVDSQGRHISIRRPWVTDDEIDKILATDGLTADEYVESVRRRYHSRESFYDSNLWPPLMALAPLMAPLHGVDACQERFIDRLSSDLARRYDARRIALGMSLDQVSALWGTPEMMNGASGGVVRCLYGSEEMDSFTVTYSRLRYVVSRVLVEFVNNRVVRVLSNDFINKDDLK